jgi:hypothetical protein
MVGKRIARLLDIEKFRVTRQTFEARPAKECLDHAASKLLGIS